MTRPSAIRLLFLAVIPILIFTSGCQKAPTNSNLPVSDEAFRGFAECKRIPELENFMSELMKTSKPFKKSEGAWFFNYSSTVMDVPIKAVAVGVCDISGERNCGWGTYIALLTAIKFDDTKQTLRAKYGIDFTEEFRSDESEVTLRPLLAKSNDSDLSWLICDPGSL